MRINIRGLSGLMVLLLGFAGGSMTSLVFLGLLLAICMGQILFDILSAPTRLGHEESNAVSLYQQMADQPENGSKIKERRFSQDHVVRKGTPNQFRRDLYSFLMEGGWLKLFVVVAMAFIAVNMIFASLYLVQPTSIVGMRGESFSSAFNFSVQTISTIGYGALSPQTGYGHTLVALQAMTGILFTALTTGLVFAKASRPQGSVVFSKPVVIANHNGVPTLQIRCANAKGHDIINASVQMTVLVDELTEEGEHIRRMLDLEVDRNHSPYFALTWTIMHQIDKNSPLYGYSREELQNLISSMICSLEGHDSTYAQTIHARHQFLSADLEFDVRFADILSTVADGRIVIDYDHFDDTIPLHNKHDVQLINTN